MAAPRGNLNARKRAAVASAGPWERCEPLSGGALHPLHRVLLHVPKGHGAGALMKLAPFQRAGIEAAYGDGGRAFAMMISKGKGKSTLLAGRALHALFDPDHSREPQIPIVAVALHQAERAVFNVAK